MELAAGRKSQRKVLVLGSAQFCRKGQPVPETNDFRVVLTEESHLMGRFLFGEVNIRHRLGHRSIFPRATAIASPQNRRLCQTIEDRVCFLERDRANHPFEMLDGIGFVDTDTLSQQVQRFLVLDNPAQDAGFNLAPVNDT